MSKNSYWVGFATGFTNGAIGVLIGNHWDDIAAVLPAVNWLGILDRVAWIGVGAAIMMVLIGFLAYRRRAK